MHKFKWFLMLMAASLVFGCGKGGKKGEADKSSFEQLQSIEADLNAAMSKVTGPIDQVDVMITRFTELPTKYKLSPDDFKAFAASMMAGQAAVPGGVDAKTAKELKGFATDFTAFKDGLMNSPANVKSLMGEVTAAVAKVPVLAGKVAAESAIVKANPFSTKDAKAKAAKQEADVKTLQTKVLGQVKQIQNKVMGLPGRATGAVAKFTKAMSSAGITSLNSLKATPGAIEKDAKDAAKDAAKSTVDSAKDAAEAATGK